VTKRGSTCAVIVLAVVIVCSGLVRAQSEQAERIRACIAAFQDATASPDNAIPRSLLNKAEAVVVFPGTIKGGFVAGAHRGHGILSVRDPKTRQWSAPAFMSLTGGSIGAQIGLSEVDIVLVVMNQRGIQNLLSNKFKVGADAAIAAGPIGRDAEASTDIQMRAEILSYSHTRGVFAGATLKGTAITTDGDANRIFYGRELTVQQIVFEGVGRTVDPVPEWIAFLTKVMP
jgi:lipid-binding SYLF domain-containing protein